MSTVATRDAAIAGRLDTMADVVERLGHVPLDRIAGRPAPGTATEADLLIEPGGNKRLCELVDCVLVEKPMASYESSLAIALAVILHAYLRHHRLGIVLGPDGLLRLKWGLVRAPDVSFISWSRFPGRKRPEGAIFSVAPDLAVEILSPSNTPEEMDRKIGEYFAAGTHLVWIMDPDAATVRVYTSPVQCSVRTVDDELDGGDVLPGLRVSIREWIQDAWPAEE
jgi:Uma2 family endonuclease